MASNVRQWLAESKHHGMKLGLDRVLSAHKALIQSPYRSTIVHVAGSNGKGTLCATLAAHLNHLGHTTVMFTSPHLIRIEERIRVNGQPLDGILFDQYLSEIRDIESALDIGLTFFEITFLVACLCAKVSDADFFIAETGLGGRYDATRIVDADVCVVTSLSLEHRDILGDTLPQIASEKAAIARPSKPLIVREVSDQDAVLAIEREALEAGRTELGEQRQPALIEWVAVPEDATFNQEALALAQATFQALELESEDLEKSMEAVNWPGRLQEVPASWDGSILFDAAHNPSGLAKVMPQLMEQIRKRQRWSLVFGCTPHDDLVAFSKPLIDLCHQHPPEFIILTKPQFGRYAGVPIEALANLDWPSTCQIYERDDADESHALLKQMKPEYSLVIGSLYLIGEMYESMNFWGTKHMDLFPANTQRDEA
ncbi:MAG: bifunctional folylpolyglutamate synthase/dihydrofolate synthase [Candidatus Poseidoniaceae archaeon]